MPTNSYIRRDKIPIWIYILQGLLCLILASQAYQYYQMNYWGVMAETASQKREILELAGRTSSMLLVSILVMISRNSSYFVVIFLLNIFRETQETFIDTMFETNQSPIVNIIAHLIIIALEIMALIKVYQISKKSES